MAPPKKLPEDDEMIRLWEEGLPYQLVADRYDVTMKHVWTVYKRLGLTNPRPRYDTYIPWRVASEHRDAHEFKALRGMEQMDLQGKREDEIPTQEASAWRSIQSQLVNYVIDYDRIRGPFWVRRLPSDGDMPIRAPEK